MSSILFIGRFQPFHQGHWWVIQKITNQKANVLIGIGSAQYKNTKDNPFSLEERMQMIEATLKEAGISKNRYSLIPIPDIHDDAKWPAHVRKLVKKDFDAVWTGRPIVKKLFEKYDDAKVVRLIRWKQISATRVRGKMIAGDEKWKELVPKAVAKVVEEIGGVERVRGMTHHPSPLPYTKEEGK